MRPNPITILKKYALFAVLLALGCTHKVVQTAQKFNLPSILPPSPTIQNFMRYGEITDGHSTGVYSISIHLYIAFHITPEVLGRAEKIKAELTNRPDFVFKPDYNLPTLTDKNQHLPDIP